MSDDDVWMNFKGQSICVTTKSYCEGCLPWEKLSKLIISVRYVKNDSVSCGNEQNSNVDVEWDLETNLEQEQPINCKHSTGNNGFQMDRLLQELQELWWIEKLNFISFGVGFVEITASTRAWSDFLTDLLMALLINDTVRMDWEGNHSIIL